MLSEASSDPSFEDDATNSRSQRRLEVSPGFLRKFRLSTGGWAIVSAADQSDGPYAIAQLWPDGDVPEDGMHIETPPIELG